MSDTARGRFITLEGGEGVGKSTQARLLVERLAGRGIETVGTREPGGSRRAEAIREVLLSGGAAALGAAGEALLFSAARIDHLDEVILPALAAGRWVVCDRFIDSTRAYQGVLGDLDPRLIRGLETVSIGDTRPDLTLIFDLPAEIGILRAAARRGANKAADRFEGEQVSFHEAVRAAFLDIATAEPRRCAVVDAWGKPDDIAEAVWDIVAARLRPFLDEISTQAGGNRVPS